MNNLAGVVHYWCSNKVLQATCCLCWDTLQQNAVTIHLLGEELLQHFFYLSIWETRPHRWDLSTAEWPLVSADESRAVELRALIQWSELTCCRVSCAACSHGDVHYLKVSHRLYSENAILVPKLDAMEACVGDWPWWKIWSAPCSCCAFLFIDQVLSTRRFSERPYIPFSLECGKIQLVKI